MPDQPGYDVRHGDLALNIVPPFFWVPDGAKLLDQQRWLAAARHARSAA